MIKRRDRLEIINTILKEIQDNNNSIKKTSLLRHTNISSQSFNEYYQELLEKQLIREEKNKKGKVYVTLTDNGFKLLEKYILIKGLIEEFEL